MKGKIYIGFSINPELRFFIRGDKEKNSLEDYHFELSGSSVNIFRALEAFGLAATILGFTAKNGVKGTARITKMMLQELLHEAGIDMVEIPCLDRTSFALTDLNKNSNAGQKGSLDHANVPLDVLHQARQESGVKIFSGVRPEEVRYVLETIGNKSSNCTSFLNCKPELLANRELLGNLLPQVDFLFMNAFERSVCTFSKEELHAFGIKMVAVTRGSNGVSWSTIHNPTVSYYADGEKFALDSKLSTVGCGDWLLGSYVGARKLLELDDSEAGIERAIYAANKVAGNKALFEGASKGPNKEQVRELLQLSNA